MFGTHRVVALGHVGKLLSDGFAVSRDNGQSPCFILTEQRKVRLRVFMCCGSLTPIVLSGFEVFDACFRIRVIVARSKCGGTPEYAHGHDYRGGAAGVGMSSIHNQSLFNGVYKTQSF